MRALRTVPLWVRRTCVLCSRGRARAAQTVAGRSGERAWGWHAMAGRTYARRIQSETGDRGWRHQVARIAARTFSMRLRRVIWLGRPGCPQPTARSSGYEGELSVKPVSEWCGGSGAAPRPLKGGALGAGGESDTNEKPRHSAQPKRLRGAVAGPFAVMAVARSRSVWCGEGCCGSRRAPALAWTGCMLCARSGGERINYSRTRGETM